MIFAACNTDNGIDVATFAALGSTMTFDDLLDLLEMKAVRDSWSHAELFNHDDKRAHDEATRAAAAGRPRPQYARPRRPR
jgi:hypothetical protein